MKFIKILHLLLMLTLSSCSTNGTKNVGDENDSTRSAPKGSIQYDAEFVKINKAALDTMRYDQCLVRPVEIQDLYDSLLSIPHDKDEKIHMVQVLKKAGFVPQTWAREKWLAGPRMISVTVSRGSCDCLIDKLYYNSDGKKKYKVTERFRCFEKKN